MIVSFPERELQYDLVCPYCSHHQEQHATEEETYEDFTKCENENCQKFFGFDCKISRPLFTTKPFECFEGKHEMEKTYEGWRHCKHCNKPQRVETEEDNW